MILRSLNLCLLIAYLVEGGVPWGALFSSPRGNSKPNNSSISHLIRQPEKPVPKLLPCGALRDLLSTGEEEILLESINHLRGESSYPNSHVCEWEVSFKDRRALLDCPHFRLTEFLCLDYVEVGDSRGVQNNYCGLQGPRGLFLVSGMRMRFSSSSFWPSQGFRCRLTLLSDEEDDSPLSSPGDEGVGTLPPIPCLCGINNIGTKIVNGTETLPGEVPWQVGLVRTNDSVPFCGGSLINDRFVLTAAHCVLGRTPYNLEVLVNLDKSVVGEEGFTPDRHQIAQIIPHRNYTASLDYDAALIKLEVPVDLKSTHPVCLPTTAEVSDYSGVAAVVTGWGYTTEDGDLSKKLRKASVTVLTQEQCRLKYAKTTDRMLCAANPGTDACQGDSGGPLFYESDSTLKKHTIIGIVSWGIGCARPNRPGVYSRVTSLLKWILRSAKNASFCSNQLTLGISATEDLLNNKN